MHYTIASFEEIHGSLTIDIIHCGNQYQVAIWDKELHDSTVKTFNDLPTAYKVYEKLISWCVFSFYSNEAKKEFLSTGMMI